VRSLHLHRQAVQPRLVSRSVGCPPPHVERQALAFGKYMFKPVPATSWPELVARRGRRRTYDTSHQVKKSVFSKTRLHILSRFQIVTVEVTLVAKRSSMLVIMREVSGSIPTVMHNF
jgi:hypothetical protein